MTKKQDNTNRFINRELSWLEFNDRVLDIARREDIPLLERLKFIAITSSNLDEFFMVRVAGLAQQVEAGRRKKDPSGMTPAGQLKSISNRCREMVAAQGEILSSIFSDLEPRGIQITHRNAWSIEQKKFTRNLFQYEILPVLTPLALKKLNEVPLLPGRVLFVAALLEPQSQSEKGLPDFEDKPGPDVVLIPVPGVFSRFITIPSAENLILAPIEQIIADNLSTLYPKRNLLSVCFFRITRDADVTIQEDEAGDLLASIEEAILNRRRRQAIRLEISSDASEELKTFLAELFEVEGNYIFEIDSLLDATSLMEIATRPGYAELKIPDWPAVPTAELVESDNLFETLQERDVMLIHPYESFDPVVRLLETAAADPNVLAIKQTLYRTSGDSPVIAALEDAAQNGKQVTVLVELKARFDEERNLLWARRLEDAGCNVIYGIAGLKTHCKALLIVRRESSRICRYAHLSTGNYNDKTAKLYSDIGLMTTDRNLTMDVSSLFNLMTGASDSIQMSKLIIAPTMLRKKITELIEREIQASTPDRPGLIMAKFNSLEDPDICRALCRASQAGVKIMLNVRGICCLRPGLKGVSENISVCSIVDRYLEHARIFYFANGGHEELYLSSADWMGRNLDRRIETMFPVSDGKMKKRLTRILELYFKDNTFNSFLQPDGSYQKAAKSSGWIRAQKELYDQAVEAAQDAQGRQKFRPIKQPD